MRNIIKIALLFWTLQLQQCTPNQPSPVEYAPLLETKLDTFMLGMGYDFEGNGKDREASKLNQVFTKLDIDSLDFPIIDGELVAALEQHLRLLRLRKQDKEQRIGNLEINLDQLKTTIEELLTWQYTKPTKLSEVLDAYQTWGEDKRGNVHFTGYFTPIIKVSKKPTATYRYPIYTRPKDWEGQLPTRQEIEELGAFDGMGLELAYAENKLDIYFMQVQGSGYVEYRNGKQELYSYDGANQHPYRSIGRYLVQNKDIDAKNISLDGIKRFFRKNPHLVDEVLFTNPSYSFFTVKSSEPKGAGHVPLTAAYSVAADRKYFPLGSCLIAKVPIVSSNGKLRQHEWRFLLAQDIGGAIRGAGHLDLYTGIGVEGKNLASALHHYGKVWLLLPKEKEVEKEKPIQKINVSK